MALCFYCFDNHQTSQCIRRATAAVVSSQQETTEAIEEQTAVIQELGYQTLDQLREMGDQLHGIHQGIAGLHDFLNWAYSETLWRMEQQIEVLTGIHDILKNPRATQADELYKMGIEAFQRHRLQDAMKLLQDARELNPEDYRVLITLGHVYVDMDDISDASECFQAAVDYARTEHYKGSALLLLARAFRYLGQKDKAILAAREASSILASNSSAHYELALCIAAELRESDSLDT